MKVKIGITKRLQEKYPDASFIGLIAAGFDNTKKNSEIDKERIEIQENIKKKSYDKKRVKEQGKFHKNFGKSFPIEFQLQSIEKGKGVPSSTPLKDVLFMMEMKHCTIISGHDLDEISHELVFDISDGGEFYITLANKEIKLKSNDIVLREAEEIDTSLMYGPGCSSKITEKTKRCLYLFWFPGDITDKEVKIILADFKKTLNLFSGKKSRTEALEVEKLSGTEFSVTPWEVKGKVNYDRLIKQFGTKPLTDELIKKIEKKAGKSHHMLRRKIFFSHRELDVLLKEYEQGKKFALYTGRGPSGSTHLGHMIPWIFCKYLQDAFGVEFYFQITDDEKYLCKPDLSLEETNKLSYENALDLVALGFDPKKTFIFVDTDYGKTMYKIATKIAKKVTASSAKAIFGFTNETNIGMYFWPAMQAATCFLPSHIHGKNIRTLIPAAIDQDPYWRIARDVAPKIGYLKTAAIHNVFLPSLLGPEGKMSTSEGQNATIFTTDSPEVAAKKIMRYAFSGGRDTLEEHRKHGGNPDIDMSYQWLRFFEEDDEKLKKIHDDYKSGKLLSGELKQILIDKVTAFLKEHQKKRKQARKHLDKFILKD